MSAKALSVTDPDVGSGAWFDLNTENIKIMKYVGKLYGRIGEKGRSYFDTGKTSVDWDELEEKALNLAEAKAELKQWEDGATIREDHLIEWKRLAEENAKLKQALKWAEAYVPKREDCETRRMITELLSNVTDLPRLQPARHVRQHRA